MHQVYTVPKVKCDGCVQAITTALNGLTGVQATQVTIPTKQVRVEFDPARIEEGRVRQTLVDAGFPPA
jgi:copper chaperone